MSEYNLLSSLFLRRFDQGSKLQLIPLGLFTAFFTFGIMMMNLLMGSAILRQVWSYTYRETPGKIISSEIIEDRGVSRSIYSLKLRYTYEIDGQHFEGKNRRCVYLDDTSLKSRLERIIARYPAEADVPVYYPSSNPESGVLVRGVEPLDGLLWLTLLLFNSVLVGLYWLFFRKLHFKSPHSAGETGG